MWRFRRLLSEHAFDKLRSIDCTFAEFAAAIEAGEVVESEQLETGPDKEVVLVTSWTRPLHVVVVVDAERGEERVVTVYEPDPQQWSSDYRRRR